MTTTIFTLAIVASLIGIAYSARGIYQTRRMHGIDEMQREIASLRRRLRDRWSLSLCIVIGQAQPVGTRSAAKEGATNQEERTMKLSMAQCQPQDPDDPCRKITFNNNLDETYPTEVIALPADNDPERELIEGEATPLVDTYEVFDSYGASKARFIIHEGVDADEELRGVLIPDLVVIAMDALERLAKDSTLESALMDAHHNLRTSLLTMHMIRAQARNMDRETQDHLRPIGIY